MATTPVVKQRTVTAGSAVVSSYSATIFTNSTYTEMTASTGAAVYIVAFRIDGNTSANLVSFATGAAGAEATLWSSGSSSIMVGQYQYALGAPIRIAAGTRLSAYVGGSWVGSTFRMTAIYVKESSVQ